MHSAGAALGDAAAEFRAGQSDFVADDPKQRRLRLDIEPMLFTVDGDSDHDATRGAFFARGGRSALAERTRRKIIYNIITGPGRTVS